MSDRAQDYFEFMCHAQDVVLDLSSHLRFDKTHPWHLNLVSLYGTILELHGSACILIRGDVVIGVPVLLRSAVEANLDFVNLAADREYGYRMEASFLKEWIKILEDPQTTSNPFLKGISSFPATGDMLDGFKKERERLKDKGYRPLQPQDKFAKADQGEAYKTVYNFLCCDSHNNIRALLSRHANISAEETGLQVEFYAPVDLERFLPHMDSFCGILITATETVHATLQSDKEAEARIQTLKNDLGKHRTAMAGEDRERPEQ